MRTLHYLHPWRGHRRGDIAEVPIGMMAHAQWLVSKKLAVWLDAAPEPPAPPPEPVPEQHTTKALAAPPQDKQMDEQDITTKKRWGRRGRNTRTPRKEKT